MHQQIANFLVGHGDKDVSSVYGEKWTKTLYKEIMLIPRYEIPELLKVSTPHRRRARRVTEIEIAYAASAGGSARGSKAPSPGSVGPVPRSPSTKRSDPHDINHTRNGGNAV